MRPDAPPIHPAAGRHKHRATPARRGWLRGRHRRPVAVAPRPVGKRRGTGRLGAPDRWRGLWHTCPGTAGSACDGYVTTRLEAVLVTVPRRRGRRNTQETWGLEEPEDDPYGNTCG